MFHHEELTALPILIASLASLGFWLRAAWIRVRGKGRTP